MLEAGVLNNPRTPVTAVTMPTIPNSSGIRSLAITTIEPVRRMNLAPWEKIATKPLRTVFPFKSSKTTVVVAVCPRVRSVFESAQTLFMFSNRCAPIARCYTYL
jgi:hypothetical protein